MKRYTLFPEDLLERERANQMAFMQWIHSIQRYYLVVGDNGKLKIVADTEGVRKTIQERSAKAELN